MGNDSTGRCRIQNYTGGSRFIKAKKGIRRLVFGGYSVVGGCPSYAAMFGYLQIPLVSAQNRPARPEKEPTQSA